MKKIFKIGSCRSSISSYLRKHDMEMIYNYDFCHTTKEVLQYLDLMEDKKRINNRPEMKCIMKDPVHYDPLKYKTYFDESDLIYIEISSIKVIECDDYFYSTTRYAEYDSHTDQKLCTYSYQMSLEELQNDIKMIQSRIQKPVIFQGHFDIHPEAPTATIEKLKKTRQVIDQALLSTATHKIILKDIFHDYKNADLLNHYADRDYNHFSSKAYELITREFVKIISPL